MSAAAKVHLVPQREVIKSFLALMTRGWENLDTPVELELRLLRDSQCDYRRFELAAIDAAAEWAMEQNEVGWTAHYIVNPIDKAQVGAARAAAIVGSQYIFIDADTPGALARIEMLALTPFVKVVAGIVPHRRLHRYFHINTGMIGIALLMARTIRHFKSDPAVKDTVGAMALPRPLCGRRSPSDWTARSAEPVDQDPHQKCRHWSDP